MMVCQGCCSKVYFVLVLPVIASPVAMPARITQGGYLSSVSTLGYKLE